MKRIILLTIALSNWIMLLAQSQEKIRDVRPLNSLSLNLFGEASIFSFNYEKEFIVSRNCILSSKIGLGFNQEFKLCLFGPCSPAHNYITIPHHITANFGESGHLFELGLGGTIVNGITNQHYVLYPIYGYRFLPLQPRKINFRIFGEIPFTGFDIEDYIFSPIGLNIGFSF